MFIRGLGKVECFEQKIEVENLGTLFLQAAITMFSATWCKSYPTGHSLHLYTARGDCCSELETKNTHTMISFNANFVNLHPLTVCCCGCQRHNCYVELCLRCSFLFQAILTQLRKNQREKRERRKGREMRKK